MKTKEKHSTVNTVVVWEQELRLSLDMDSLRLDTQSLKLDTQSLGSEAANSEYFYHIFLHITFFKVFYSFSIITVTASTATFTTFLTQLGTSSTPTTTTTTTIVNSIATVSAPSHTITCGINIELSR